MEHSVVTKGSLGVKPARRKSPASIDTLESFFHENGASGIPFLEGDKMKPSIPLGESAQATTLNVISPRKQGFRMFQYEEFHYRGKILHMAVDFA